MLESDIQHRIIDIARARGVYCRKMVAIAYRGFPDLFMARGGLVMLWEVKRMKGAVSVTQEREHRAIAAHGVSVIVTFGLWDAIKQLDIFYPEKA